MFQGVGYKKSNVKRLAKMFIFGIFYHISATMIDKAS